MAFMDYVQGPKHKARSEELEQELLKLKKEYTQLQVLAKQFGALEVADIRKLIDTEHAKLKSVRDEVAQTQAKAATVASQVKELQDQILVFEEQLLLESFALYIPKFKLNSSAEYKTRLDTIRAQQKALIKEGFAATGDKNWTVNGKLSEGRKLVNDTIKLLIRSFNNECDYCVDNVKFNNVELGEKRIHQSFDACNKLGRVMSVELSSKFLSLKLDELHLAHEFQLKKQEEKEEARRLREELREQQKLEQEIRAAREKIAKERKHFEAALQDLRARLEKAESEDERSAFLLKITETEANKAALDAEEKVIDYREQNAKAGYVYVISNVGAFGEGVYKIGMTRRINPMERVDELGDASVPFWFDVHAMVFSNNAPALEAKLHEKFAQGRLNKINARKEFFRADIKEIETVIRSNFDAVVEVVHEAPAEQYRESLLISRLNTAAQQTGTAAVTN